MPSSRDEIRLSPTSNRKFNKPLMEKRRRARINDSLGQLKTLVLQAMKKDSTQYSKLEKADILEMTLKYLRNVQRQEVNASLDTSPQMIGKYRSGFNECASEVARYFNSMPAMQTETKTRVLNHLANCVNNIPSYPDELHATQTLPGARQPLHVQVNAMRNYPQMNYYSGGPMQLAAHEHQATARFTRGLSASPTAPTDSHRAFMNYRSPSPSSTIGQNDSFMDMLSIKSESPRSSPSCSNVSVDSQNWSSDMATIKGEIISQGPISPPDDDKVWRPW